MTSAQTDALSVLNTPEGVACSNTLKRCIDMAAPFVYDDRDKAELDRLRRLTPYVRSCTITDVRPLDMRIPQTVTVSPGEGPVDRQETYRMIISTAAHDIHNRTFVIPASQLREEHELLNSVKGVAVPKPTMQELLDSGSLTHPSTTTGHVVCTDTLTFLQAQKKQKVTKASEAVTRSQALQEKRAEAIVQRKADAAKVLAAAQGANGAVAWKSLLRSLLEAAFRSWGGVMSTLADTKKPTLILALEPLIAIKLGGGQTAEEEEPELAEMEE